MVRAAMVEVAFPAVVVVAKKSEEEAARRTHWELPPEERASCGPVLEARVRA
jgi:hypothetical protein